MPVFSGLLLTGVVAAIMSTADSQLLLGSAIATDDLPLLRRVAGRIEEIRTLGASGRAWLGRVLLLVIGGAAGGSAIIAPDSVASLVGYAWGGMGGIRADHHSCSLLAQVQLLGRAGFHLGGSGHGEHLAVQLGRTVGHVLYGDSGRPRIHGRDSRRRRSHVAHVPTDCRGHRAVRPGKRAVLFLSGPGLLCGVATVYDQLGAGHVGRLVGSQEQHTVGYLVGMAGPSHGVALLYVALHVGVGQPPCGHGRIN